MSETPPTIAYWKGRPLDEMSKDELIEVIQEQAEAHQMDIATLYRYRQQWFDALSRRAAP